MRDTDRAAVISFEHFALTRLGLTTLTTADARNRVNTALEHTRYAGGGTNISAAVAEATRVLSQEPGQRLRIAFLITDGQSGYDPALTTRARDAGITIYTIGLGTSVDSHLLRGIADGTGGKYINLVNAADLVPVYEQLVGDIIDDGTDTDGDAITDCVERNGAFAPYGLLITSAAPDGPQAPGRATFVTTSPTTADTDGDALADGRELSRRSFADHPYLAAEYGFLIESGLTTFYRMTSDPTALDTDRDGIDDGDDARPLHRVTFEDMYGIPGLRLLANTLFQPARHTDRPAVADDVAPSGTHYTRIRFSPDVVRYDTNNRCVANCTALTDAARLRVSTATPTPATYCYLVPLACLLNGDLFSTPTAEAEMRTIVKEVRIRQRIFDDEGHITREFAADQSYGACEILTTAPTCEASARDITQADIEPADLPNIVTAQLAKKAPTPGGGIRISPGYATSTATAVRSAGTAIQYNVATQAAATASTTALATAVTDCFALPVVAVYKRVSIFQHPCADRPGIITGTDMPEATDHNIDAILADPRRTAASYATPAERDARVPGHTWYNSEPECTPSARVAAQQQRPGVRLQCDETPHWSTEQAGPGASLRIVRESDNLAEGNALQQFYRICQKQLTRPISNPIITMNMTREPFVFGADQTLPKTTAWCR